MRTLSRFSALILALAMLGGGVAYAGEGETGDEGNTEKTEEVSNDTGEKGDGEAKPALPDELAAAVESYKSALREWRHCIIDMVSGDGGAEDCGGAPDPADHGLSTEDLISYDLDEQMIDRVETRLSKVEIKNACIVEFAADGRRAVYQCVADALGIDLEERLNRRCTRAEARGADATTPVPSTDKAVTAHDCTFAGERNPEKDGGGRGFDRDGRGQGRDGSKDA